MTLHVGTYAEGGGKGLVLLAMEPDGSLRLGEAYPEAANASFAVHSPRHGLQYVADEEEQGAINVLRRDAGGWRRLARVATGGAAPCYLALDSAETRLAVANYESGSAALFELDGAGIPRTPASLFQSGGKGPVEDRQEGPHAHCVRFTPDGEALLLVDLGSDRILRLALDGGAFGEATTAWHAPPGTGPRHLQLHPQASLAVLLSELASTLTVLHVEGEAMRPHLIRSTVPAEFSGENLGGHLELNAAGDRIYVSNRGHNSIAVFALDAERGDIELLQHVASGGDHPRHFVLLEEEGLFVVAHENDGRITSFRVADDGRLSPTGESVEVPGACFLLRDS